MELGTYCGYTAVRIGRLLPPGTHLVSVEIEPLFAAIASKDSLACTRFHMHQSHCVSWGVWVRARAVWAGPEAKATSLLLPQVVEHAGLRDSVSVEIGSVPERLPSIQRKHGNGPLTTLLLDHKVHMQCDTANSGAI